MSRKSALVSSPEADLHAYNRGVDKGILFQREGDFNYFISLLHEGLENAGLDLLAYTLLPNHFHVLVHQTHPYAISQYLKKVCMRYARSFNGRRGRVGHLFGDRFKVAMLRTAADLLLISHYIHLNPVRAGLVGEPTAWRFSSMRDYAEDPASTLVARGRILKLVGGQEEYMRFMKEYDPARPGTLHRYLQVREGQDEAVQGAIQWRSSAGHGRATMSEQIGIRSDVERDGNPNSDR